MGSTALAGLYTTVLYKEQILELARNFVIESGLFSPTLQ
ncbi:hypothetical [Yersinia pestis KIM10+]|uniref:Uncharacterized protein n=1 Tax=Yersinia pestis TaxID=632 RepID=Q8CL32_YERPE|nr:hypothetical [Yersinia pestis KIM10+]